jgi:hypothetical protein
VYEENEMLKQALVFVYICAAAASAQAPAGATIDPGMTREQVVARLGQPLSARAFQSFTYLLYRNGCEKSCGMNDLVVLDSNRVIDAVFRSSARHYTGTSSSPRMIPAVDARRGAAAPATPAAPLKVPSKMPPAPPKPNKPPRA